jgi:hypothetical protein
MLVQRVRGDVRSRFPVDGDGTTANTPAAEFTRVRRAYPQALEGGVPIQRTRVMEIAALRDVQKHELLPHRHLRLPGGVDANRFGVFGTNHVRVRQGDADTP